MRCGKNLLQPSGGPRFTHTGTGTIFVTLLHCVVLCCVVLCCVVLCCVVLCSVVFRCVASMCTNRHGELVIW